MTVVVASIDFGTTFSSWAYLTNSDFEQNPSHVCAQTWNNGVAISQKTSSTLLLRSDQSFEAFGFDAESKYAELAEKNEHREWYYCYRFKMLLHNRKIRRDILLDDATGKQVKALTVFSLSIQFLKDDLIKVLKSSTCGLSSADIHWVLTVPAIWDDDAKQFMREAAVNAGIPGKDLTIALEPECASLYCRLLPVESVATRSTTLSSFSVGEKYLVVDAGGGTVDISVHQILDDNTLRELHRARGGPWGGTTVDKAFEKFMDDIAAQGVMEKLRNDCMDAYLDIMNNFEVKKRAVETNKDQITITLPPYFLHLAEKTSGMSLKESISRSRYSKDLNFLEMRNKLRVAMPVMIGLFDEAVTNIVEHIRNLYKDECLEDCEAIVMVGGLSEGQVLQKALKDNFTDKKIIVPNEAGLAVLKGAAVFGYNPCAITERVCRYTYGTRASHEYDVSCNHRMGRTDLDENNILRCYDIFDIHVVAGQAVRLGELLAGESYSPITDDQESVTIDIYRSLSTNPELTTEDDCVEIGSIKIPLPHKNECNDRSVMTKFMFGGTEILVEVEVVATGKRYTLSIDFLN